jgi:hypothetical protein
MAPPGAAAGGYAPPPGVFDRQSLIHALGQIQRGDGIVPGGANWGADTLGQHLLQRIFPQVQESARPKLPDDDRQVLELVSMLFGNLLTDRNVSDPAKLLIARLQVPVLKMALLDPTFFRNPNHPAREFVNLITLLGTAHLSPESDTFHRMEVITDRVVNRFDTEPTVFIGALEELRALEKSDLNAFMEEEQERARQRRAELIARAREQVKAALLAALNGTTVSPQLQHFLQHGWGPLLVVKFLSHGRQSHAWTQAEQLLTRLIALAPPKCRTKPRTGKCCALCGTNSKA